MHSFYKNTTNKLQYKPGIMQINMNEKHTIQKEVYNITDN